MRQPGRRTDVGPQRWEGFSSFATLRRVTSLSHAEAFEAHAVRYDVWFEKHRAAYESELGAVRSLKPPRGRWLEIGVGTGRFAARLGVSLGVEPSVTMGRIARERGVEVVRGVAEALPFADDRFDGVLFVTTICFVRDLAASLREAHRILRPAGVLVVGFVDKASPLGRAYQERRGQNVFYRDATFYSTPELLGVMEHVGFRQFDFAQTIFHRLDEIRKPESSATGYGRGSFVVVRGVRGGGASPHRDRAPDAEEDRKLRRRAVRWPRTRTVRGRSGADPAAILPSGTTNPPPGLLHEGET